MTAPCAGFVWWRWVRPSRWHYPVQSLVEVEHAGFTYRVTLENLRDAFTLWPGDVLEYRVVGRVCRCGKWLA